MALYEIGRVLHPPVNGKCISVHEKKAGHFQPLRKKSALLKLFSWNTMFNTNFQTEPAGLILSNQWPLSYSSETNNYLNTHHHRILFKITNNKGIFESGLLLLITFPPISFLIIIHNFHFLNKTHYILKLCLFSLLISNTFYLIIIL
jgi:hypothetical protein